MVSRAAAVSFEFRSGAGAPPTGYESLELIHYIVRKGCTDVLTPESGLSQWRK